MSQRASSTYQVLRFKSRREWLSNRVIGGSSLATILGYGRFETKDELFNSLLRPSEKEEKTQTLINGSKAEDHIRQLFLITHPKYRLITQPKNGWIFRDKEKPWRGVSPDGILIDRDTKEKWGLEIKFSNVTKTASKDEWEGNEIPKQYVGQVTQYLMVITDLVGVKLVPFLYREAPDDDGNWEFEKAEMREYTIKRSDFQPYVDYASKKEDEFYAAVKSRRRPATEVEIDL